MGAGPIGILLMQALRALGTESVMSTDISDYRLGMAKKCGADFTYNTKNITLGDAMVEAFSPDKADFIYDCAGNDISMGQAIKYARKGSTIVLVAVFAKMANIDLAVLGDHEVTLTSSMMYMHEDYAKAIELVMQKKVNLQPMITKIFKCKEWLDAYQFIDNNKEITMKVLIEFRQLIKEILLVKSPEKCLKKCPNQCLN